MMHSELRESGYTVVQLQADTLSALVRLVQGYLDDRSWNSERCVGVSHSVRTDPLPIYTALVTIAHLKRDYNSK